MKDLEFLINQKYKIVKEETISKLEIVSRFDKAPEKQKKALRKFFGEDFFKVDITDRVKSFEDACDVLDRPTLLPSVSMLPEKHQKAIISHYKLITITEALNEGWVPDWANKSEYKWFPWWYVDPDSSHAGLANATTNYTATLAAAYSGSRLGFKTEALARYAADQFKDLYEAFLLFL